MQMLIGWSGIGRNHRGPACRAGKAPIGAIVILVLALGGGGAAWYALRDPLRTGRQAYARGDWELAFKEARGLLDSDREALRLAARSAVRLGRDELARIYYRKLGDADSAAEDEYLLATLARRQGKDVVALGLLEQALAKDPDHAEALARAIELERGFHFYTKATPRARRLAGIAGWEARGSWALGELLERQFEPNAAARSLEDALRLDSTGRSLGVERLAALKLASRAYLRGNQPNDAIRVLDHAKELKNDGEVQWLISRAYLQLGIIELAQLAFELSGDYEDLHPLEPDPAPYVGAARCAECHATIHAAQQRSPHARTFKKGPILAKESIPERAITDPGDPGITHKIERDGERLRVGAESKDGVARAFVQYAMGSGTHATTWVVREESGPAHEYRLTRFAGEIGWDLTPLHPKLPPDPAERLGPIQSEDSVHNCLGCHSTTFRAARDGTGPEAADHGIGCERCHGPGGNHVVAVAAEEKFSSWAIARPTMASGEDRTMLCVKCHQAPGFAAPGENTFVRFQWPALGLSRCYTQSDGGLDCVSCHDPHAQREPTAAEREATCLSCHAQPAGDQPPKRRARKNCKVNPERDCLRCHMPTISNVLPHIPFTDHYIRVRNDDPPAGSAPAGGAAARDEPSAPDG